MSGLAVAGQAIAAAHRQRRARGRRDVVVVPGHRDRARGRPQPRARSRARAAREHGSAALAANALHFASDFAGTLAVLAGLICWRAPALPEGDAIAAPRSSPCSSILAARAADARERAGADGPRARGRCRGGARGDRGGRATRRAAARAHARGRRPRVRRRRRSRSRPTPRSQQGHAVADNVERAIGAALPDSDVTVHMEPLGERRPARARDRRGAVGAACARGPQRALRDARRRARSSACTSSCPPTRHSSRRTASATRSRTRSSKRCPRSTAFTSTSSRLPPRSRRRP